MPKKIGIFPLAVTLIILGVAIVLNKFTGKDWFGEVLAFWPLVLIAIGAEILWRQSRFQAGKGPAWKLDGKSLVLLTLVLVISGAGHFVNSVVGSYTKDGVWGFLRGWNGDFHTQTVPLRDEDLSLGDAESLYIENSFGRLRVEGTSENRVHLRAEAGVNVMDRGAAENRAKQIDIQVTQGKEAKLIVQDREINNRNNNYSVNLVLQVPERMLIRSNTDAGEVDMSGVAGVDVETDMGKIILSNIKGSAKARSNAGLIEANDVGSADLQSDMGRVSVNEVKGTVSAKTNAGEVEVRTSTPVGGDWDLQTDMGAITLAYPPTSSVRFEGKTDMGAIKGLNVNQNGPESSATFGDGKYKITARTDTGKIEIQ